MGDLVGPFRVGGRVFRLDDNRDETVLWDVTDAQHEIEVAAFLNTVDNPTPSAIMQKIEEYLCASLSCPG